MEPEAGRSPASGVGLPPASRAESEGWIPCHGYEGYYEVSNLGRIRAAETGRILSVAGTDKDGYPVVSLNLRKVRKTHVLHRLIALSFHGDKCNALHNEVAHLDGIRTNCRADNLKWCSKVENHFHMIAHGTHPTGSRHPKAKLTPAIVRSIRALERVNCSELARLYGVSQNAIWKVKEGRTWRTI